jgi:Ca2+-binding EF-hand superfamily protein
VATGKTDVKNLFDRFDKDRDGKIGYKDFANEMLTVEQ